jgi:hypothetical protein
MIGVLLVVVVVYALEIYFMLLRFWFGYILILILLRGVLVVFTYVVSLVPNERFEYFSFLMILVGILFFIGETRYKVLSSQSLVTTLLWGGVMGGYILYLAIFLLRVIVIVVFVSSPSEGPLRVFLYAWLKG